LKVEGIELTHIIGPQTAHKYHPDSKAEINRRINRILEKERDPVPRKVRFTTWTLRYNEMLWVTVDGMEEHWNRARVDAEIDEKDNAVTAMTKNVSALTFSMPPGLCPLDDTRPSKVVLDGQKLEAPAVMSDRSWAASFRKQGRKWALVGRADGRDLRKTHGLQGPIDDAFMDSFIMVRPTGRAMNEKTGAWAVSEMNHAIDHWRRQFRGDAPVKDDSKVTDEDIADNNLILWGDSQSNKVLTRIADKLPIQWNAQGVRVGKKPYAAAHHVPALIYPNPLNPKRYVVLNSGFTFREYDYLNNARQVAKLPDWAIVDVNLPVSSRAPGGIVGAGFFGERWELKDDSK
jgi:hypothetical protein